MLVEDLDLKFMHMQKMLLLAWASKKLKDLIKWVAERSESFLSDCHGRDHITHVELAIKNDGKINWFKS